MKNEAGLGISVPQDTIVYVEIKFPKTVDVLVKPMSVELLFRGEREDCSACAAFMAIRSDQESGDCFLSYVTEKKLPQGKFAVEVQGQVEFEIHQRGGEALYSPSEFYASSRSSRKTQPVLIRRSYSCRIASEVEISGQAPEICITATAEPSRTSMQQAVRIMDTGRWQQQP